MMASFEVFLRKNGLLLSSFRMATALILFILDITDSGGLEIQPNFDDITFLIYFLWSVILLLICLARWELSYLLMPFVLIVDIIIFLIIPHVDLSNDTDVLIGTTVLGALSILEAGMRWGSRQAITLALTLNLVCFLNCFAGMNFHEHHLDHFVRQVIILAIGSLVAIWISYRIAPPKLPIVNLDGALLSSSSLDALLTFAMKGMNSRRGCLTWLESGEDRVPIEVSRNWRQSDIDLKPQGCVLWPDDAEFRILMVGGTRRLVLRTNSSGRFIHTKLDHPLRQVVPSWPNETIFTAKIKGLSGEGVLVLGNVILPASEDILLFNNVVMSLERALEKLAQAENERTAAIQDTREVIARDLHDSVAQSLAGAKFHLAALLRSDLPPSVSSQISKLRDAIDQEHVAIKNYIDALQSKGDAPDDRESLNEIEELCRRLESTWNIKVELDECSDFNPLERADLLEIQQIIREAVANSVRHGSANHVIIRFAANDLGMRLSISDNGVGMKPEMVLGFPKSIKARMAALRGTLKVKSGATGVELQMFIPMKAEN